MAGLTADQIIERIANANGVEPGVIRQQIEQALQNIIVDTTQPHSFMLADLFPGSKPTVDELVVALEYELSAACNQPGKCPDPQHKKNWQVISTCQFSYFISPLRT